MIQERGLTGQLCVCRGYRTEWCVTAIFSYPRRVVSSHGLPFPPLPSGSSHGPRPHHPAAAVHAEVIMISQLSATMRTLVSSFCGVAVLPILFLRSLWEHSASFLPSSRTLLQAIFSVPICISAHSLNGDSLVLPQMSLTYFSDGPNDDSQDYYFWSSLSECPGPTHPIACLPGAPSFLPQPSPSQMPAFKLFLQMALSHPLGLPLNITASKDVPGPHYLK